MTLQLNTVADEDDVVVALHSSASDHSQWKPLIMDLQDRYHVFAFDLPGYGDGPVRNTALKGMAAVAQPLIETIEAFEMPVHLVGHSFGGAVALKIALLRPDLVKSLTLYEPATFSLLNNEKSADREILSGMKKVASALGAATAAGRNDLGMRAFVDYWNGNGTWDRLPQKLQERTAQTATLVSADFKCGFEEAWNVDRLAALTMPVLIMTGMESPVVAQRTADQTAACIPNAEHAILPGLGHMAPVHSPDWVNPRILQHVARARMAPVHVCWPEKAAA
ncbi:MAG: alpha/beta fold hydrolase [Pseudomonadota bacterium]